MFPTISRRCPAAREMARMAPALMPRDMQRVDPAVAAFAVGRAARLRQHLDGLGADLLENGVPHVAMESTGI